MITVPGLNSWALEEEKQQNSVPCTVSNNASLSTGKRALEEDFVLMEMKEPKRLDTSLNVKVNETKNEPNNIVSPEYILNSPLPDRPSKACIVKIYIDTEKVKINTLIEVVGFLSVDPEMAAFSDDEDSGENMVRNPPPSLVPRIHAVIVNYLEHYNPLVDNVLRRGVNKNWALKVHKDLHTAFTQVLFGDELAADYMICHLMSKIYLRRDIVILGKFCMNLSNIPLSSSNPAIKNYTKLLYGIIEKLLPASHYIPLTIENLNTMTLVPKKDYTTNRVVSGQLQLCRGTHLVLDETCLSEGKLDNTGLMNLTTLRTLIEEQKLDYDFQYYKMPFDCDIPILVLSEGKSLLNVNFHVPLIIDPQIASTIVEVCDAVRHFLSSDVLKQARIYLTTVSHNNFDINKIMQETIENDFIMDMRQCGSTTENLHELMVLSRFLGLCEGEIILTPEVWVKTREMEKQRKLRFDKPHVIEL